MEALSWSLIYVCIYMKLFCEVGDQLSLMLFQYLYVNFQTNDKWGDWCCTGVFYKELLLQIINLLFCVFFCCFFCFSMIFPNRMRIVQKCIGNWKKFLLFFLLSQKKNHLPVPPPQKNQNTKTAQSAKQKTAQTKKPPNKQKTALHHSWSYLMWRATKPAEQWWKSFSLSGFDPVLCCHCSICCLLAGQSRLREQFIGL